MSSVGFSSQLPSIGDFLNNQGAFIDTQILMTIIGSAQADTISKSVAAQANQLAGQMAKAGAFNDTAVVMNGMPDKIIKTETDAVDAKAGDLAARQAQTPLPATGAKPNLDSWTYGGTLTYSDDADAQFLKDRGLPVATYVPAQSKTFTIPNQAKIDAQNLANQYYIDYLNTPDKPADVKLAAYNKWQNEQNYANGLPPTVQVTQTAPQVGTPDAYDKNQATLAAYKQSLADGAADNKVVNDLTKNSPDLQAVSGDLASEGVATPTKFNELQGAVAELGAVGLLLSNSINQLRGELFTLLDKANASFDFLNTLAADLGKDGAKEVDKLQKKVAETLNGVDLSRLLPQDRNAVEDALIRLASVLPDGDMQKLLETLPKDQQQEVLKQISTFQKELEALQGDAAPPAAAPSFQLNSRLVRV